MNWQHVVEGFSTASSYAVGARLRANRCSSRLRKFAGKPAPTNADRAAVTSVFLRAAALSCTVLLTCSAAHGADLALTRPWYKVELIVFERLYAPTTQERLIAPEPGRFARNVLAFDEDRAPYYAVDPAVLELPSVFPPDPSYNPPLADVMEPDDADPSSIEGAAPLVDVPAPTPTPTPAEALAAAIAKFEAELESTSLRWLPRSALVLTSEARRLGARGAFRVLLHGAFVQAAPPRESPIPLLIQTGDRFGDRWSVEGTVSVTLARFLHVHAQLWRAPFAGAPDVQVLDEHRRMRSGELHYLDHPTFGMLVRIDPIAPTQALIDQAAEIGDS